MKVRSLGELCDFLDKELAWRKRELTTIRLRLPTDRLHQRHVTLRSAVCLLYAHWEGFIKRAGTAYIAFVARQGLRLRDLSASFLTLAIEKLLAECEQTKKLSIRIRLVSLLLSDLAEPASLPSRGSISTGSNLNSERLHEILALLGLDNREYAKKQLLIDGRLLDWRNHVAHGDRFEVDERDYVTLHSEVISLLERFRTDVENAAMTGLHKRP